MRRVSVDLRRCGAGLAFLAATLEVDLDAQIPPPPNDNFASASVLSGTSTSAAGLNAGATMEPGEPDHSGGGYAAGRSIWWRWTAPNSGTIQLDTAGSSFNTALAVYTGNVVSNLVRVTNNVFGGSNGTSRLVFSAVSGVPYRIAVDGITSSPTGSVSLHLQLLAPPSNDNFSAAARVSGTNITVDGSTEAATLQASEPPATNGSHTVWFSWTAPWTGKATAREVMTSVLRTEVFVGSSLNNLRLVTDLNGGFYMGSFEWKATNGVTYYVRISGEQARLTLRLWLEGIPPNDDFVNRVSLNGTNVSAAGTTQGASLEPGEPIYRLGSVWYSWRSPVGGKATAEWSGADEAQVFTGSSVSNLVRLSSIVPNTWRMVWKLAAGSDYPIRALGSGTFNVHMWVEPFLPNDDFANAVGLTGTNATAAGTTLGATVEPGEPADGPSVWYSWRAPVTGKARADVTFSARVDVFTGGSVDALSPVTKLDLLNESEVALWRVTNGVTYYLRVTPSYSSGPFDLQLKANPYPVNDDFAHRIHLAGAEATGTGSNVGATREEGEPRHAEQRANSTIWWSWTAPASGQATASTEGSGFDTVLAVYTGNDWAGLKWVNADNDSGAGHASRVVFDAVAGETYQIAVSGFALNTWVAEEEGAVSLSVHLGLPVTAPHPSAPAVLPNALFSQAGVVKVFATQPDGKLILGGSFFAVNGQARRNVARLNENGSLDLTWEVEADGEVVAVLVQGTNIFLGGRFAHVNGVARAALAKVNSLDGTLDLAWDPRPQASIPTSAEALTAPILALAAAGSSLYVGGNFSAVGGLARTNLAKLAIAGSGAADPIWEAGIGATVTPYYGQPVLALVAYQSQLIVGGRFGQIQGVSRDGLARVNLTGPATLDLNWNPQFPNGGFGPHQLLLSGTNLIVGHGCCGGYAVVTRVSLGGTGTVDSTWNTAFGFGFSFLALAMTEDALFVLHDSEFEFFTMEKRRLLDLAPYGAPWQTPDFRRSIYRPPEPGPGGLGDDPKFSALAVKGNRVLVGGTFSSVNGQPALGLAGMDSVTGEPDASFAVFAQQPGRVLAVARQPDGKIIAGGEFDMVDDLPRANLARFTAEGALDPTWFPNPNGSVNALVAAETNLYVAGFFRELKNRPRPYLARLDYASDLAHNWPVSGGAPPLTSLVATPTRLFGIAESLGLWVFTREDGTVEQYSGDWVRAMALQPDGRLVLAGDNLDFGLPTRPDLLRLNTEPPFDPDPTWVPDYTNYYRTVALTVDGTNLFVGNESSLFKFSLLGSGQSSAGWAPPDVFSVEGSFSPTVLEGVRALAVVESDLYVGGSFWPIGAPIPSVGGGGKTMLVRLDRDTGGLKAIWNAGPSGGGEVTNAAVFSLFPVGNDLYVGGGFARFGDEVRFGLAQLASPDAPILIEEADGRITLLRNPADGSAVTHFRILSVTGGTLSRVTDGTPVQPGDFVTLAEGEAGLRFAVGSGAGSVTAVSAVSGVPAGVGTAATTLNLQSAAVPLFSFAQEEYRVSEASASVSLTIVKRGLGAGSVKVSTLDGTATASQFLQPGDYQGGSGHASFTSAMSTYEFRVGLERDGIFEGDEVFYVTLSEPSLGTRIGYPATARVVIVDDDAFGSNGSFLTNQLPAGRPVSTGGLTVYLENDVGEWRLAGEWDWHLSGETVLGLTATNYIVEFKPVFGFLEPGRQTLPIFNGLVRNYTNQYQPAEPIGELGALTVVIDPEEVSTGQDPAGQGQWRLAGEANWRQSGQLAADLSVGYHEILLKPLSNYFAYLPEPVVWVSGDRVRTNFARYVRASGTGYLQPRLLTLPEATGTPPYLFNGQIKTPLGVGSGVVVKEGVVLTAAHLVFDDRNLELVPAPYVFWRFQRYRDQYEPLPQTPYGTVILDGYASQRTNDLRVLRRVSPGESTPESQNLDVALLFFLEQAGRGGFGGFLASEDPNVHLLSARRKMLVGYPQDGVGQTAQGKLHATVPTNANFQLLYPGSSVYLASSIRGFPGNSGGPLYVESEAGGVFYPAGVYVGQTAFGETLVRGIDHVVVDYINRVEELSLSGPNHPGGGFSPFIPGITEQPAGTGRLTFELDPVAARVAGAGWRIRQNPDRSYQTNHTVTYALTAGVDYNLEFRPAPGFIAPQPQLVRVALAEVSSIRLYYVAWPAELTLAHAGQLGLAGSNRGRYVIDYRDDLNRLVPWQPWTNFTLTNGSVFLELPPRTNVLGRFFRARLVP